MKVGDFVKVVSKMTDPPRTLGEGLITDCFEDANGFWMYEVTSFNPPDRGWFSDLQLKKVTEDGRE